MTTSHESAHAYFGGMAESYDSLIRRAVPRYAEMTERLVTYLPNDSKRVLELGCGTGNLSLALVERFPNSTLTLVDASEEMIALTRERVEARFREPAASVSYLVARFEDLEFPAGSFDLVTSSISLHHVRDKALLYERIGELLADGGRFCFGDQMRGEPESNHLVNWEQWLAFCRQSGNCTPEELAGLVDHAEAHDHYTPVGEHFSLLSRAGFREIDCVWRNWMWGIITATAAQELN